MIQNILEVRQLKKYFPVKGGLWGTVGYVKALDGVDLEISKGQIFGLVGESGCGKTTLGRCILRLIEPTGGEILLDGVDLMKLKHNALNEARRNMQIVYQNPFLSLDPRMRIRDIVAEPLKTHRNLSESQIFDRVLQLLRLVGLEEEHMLKYPHELSGGQNQRVAVARALALEPKFVVLDEPTSALDVSVQAQILNLLKNLQRTLALSYLLISHDLSVVQHVSDRLAVMYLGKIVETGSSEEIWSKPLHPYTTALFSAAPIPDPDIERQYEPLRGEVPSLTSLPTGCRFRTRCPLAFEKCKVEEPPLTSISRTRSCACHLIAEQQ
jgi:oligopeptide/dipeptide ABC transporter ATP-binding protein